MASFIDGNLSQNTNVHGVLPTAVVANQDIVKDYARLQILYTEILENLSPPMTLYSSGDFDTLIEDISGEILPLMNTLNSDETFYYGLRSSYLLKAYEYNEQLVPNYRSLSNTLIDVLQKGISEVYKVRTLETENATLLTYKEILEDRSQLTAYVNQIQRTSFLFSAEATYKNDLEIKLWYQVYLERHGAPSDGVFESDKLAIIIDELVESGQVSENELIY
jgi:hypothetical protein